MIIIEAPAIVVVRITLPKEEEGQEVEEEQEVEDMGVIMAAGVGGLPPRLPPLPLARGGLKKGPSKEEEQQEEEELGEEEEEEGEGGMEVGMPLELIVTTTGETQPLLMTKKPALALPPPPGAITGLPAQLVRVVPLGRRGSLPARTSPTSGTLCQSGPVMMWGRGWAPSILLATSRLLTPPASPPKLWMTKQPTLSLHNNLSHPLQTSSS